MRTSMAYFAGAGTVLAAIVGGVGGGLLIADIVSPKSPKQELSRLERHVAQQPIPAAATPSEPVPYLSAPQPSAPGTTVAAAQEQPRPQTQTASAAPPAQPADAPQTKQAESQTKPAESPAKQAEAPAPKPAAPVAQPVAHELNATPDDALARARGGEVRRAEANRKFERRQQWTERRRYKQRQQQELIAVEEMVREDTEPRREYVAEPAKIEMPLIRLFGPE
jgi:hypothetical protein